MKPTAKPTLTRLLVLVVAVVAALAWYPLTRVAAYQAPLVDATPPRPTADRVVVSATDASGLFKYEVLQTFGGDLRARVQIDFRNPGVFEAYQQLAQDHVDSLKQATSPGIIPATITFWSPVSLEDTRQLVAQIGLEVLSYGAFGKNITGTQASLYVWPEKSDLAALPVVEDFQPDGIMTITGLLNPTPPTLDALSSDGRIALVDLMATEVDQRIEAELGASIDVTQIGFPNPGWYLYSGEIPRQ